MRRAGSDAGFSLIEALVALIIAAVALSAIFALQQQIADGQRRQARTLRLVALQRNALALTQDLNPMDRPQGAIRLAGGEVVRWQARPLTEAKAQAGVMGAPGGRYQVALFHMKVDIIDARGQRLGGLDFDRVGWRATRPSAP